MIHDVTDDTIDDVLHSNNTFIILFYSDRLSHFDNIIKIFENLVQKFKNKIMVYKCNMDIEYKKISKYFNMNVVPGMIMMKNNIVYANIAGSVSAIKYEEEIKKGILEIINDTNIIKTSAFYQE